MLRFLMTAKSKTKDGNAATGKTAAEPVSDLKLIRRLWLDVIPDLRLFIGALLLYIPVLAPRFLELIFLSKIIDEGYFKQSLAGITYWSLAYLVVVFVRAMFEMAQLYIMQLMGQRAVKRLRERIFGKIQRLPMSYFDRTPLGKIMTRAINDVESLLELFSSGAVRILGDILFLIGLLVGLFATDVKLTLSGIAILPVLALGVSLFRTRARIAFARVKEVLSSLNGQLQEAISGMHIVQLFVQDLRIQNQFDNDNRDYMLANRNAIVLDAGVYAFVDAISTISVAVVLLVGAGMQQEGALTLGVLVAFVKALEQFFFPIRELSNRYTVVQSAFASAERIFALEDEPEVSESGSRKAVFDDELFFDNVRFRYAVGEDILKGLSFRVKAGEKIAIVGHTGAGKSTIVKLVSRMYDVTDGSISFDKHNIQDFSLESLRSLSCAVPQDVFLFSGTLRENLVFGSPDVDDNMLLKAIRACQAVPVLMRLLEELAHPDESSSERASQSEVDVDDATLLHVLQSEVKERGANFSMGERQILAFVRALVVNPPLIILDEATASVDKSTERHLQVATETLMKGRTALIIAHRLSTIQQCDRILVLHQGQLAEQGSHDELLQKGGRYAKLVELQERSDTA
ncbi:MAG: ABC transporter ATP-binding protein [Deltaproteobacteria bacterium]|nr:ABC transporter ATP-binding protein [Deltaproteobacteria bacterium]